MTDMWESVAGGWDRNADFVDAQLAEATALMLEVADVRPGDAVLELACGPGGAGLAAAAVVGEGGRVVLSDAAPSMVAAAGRRAADVPHAETLVCDQTAIAADDASFDVVLCRFGLMFVEPPADAVREATRVLKPGGRYAAMTWAPRAANPWLGLILDAVGEQFGVPFPPPSVPGPFALDEPDKLTAVIEAGGLADVEVAHAAATMAIASLEEWWDRVPQLAGPLAMALAGMEPDVRDAIRDRALIKADAALAGGHAFAGAALIGVGRPPQSVHA